MICYAHCSHPMALSKCIFMTKVTQLYNSKESKLILFLLQGRYSNITTLRMRDRSRLSRADIDLIPLPTTPSHSFCHPFFPPPEPLRQLSLSISRSLPRCLSWPIVLFTVQFSFGACSSSGAKAKKLIN